MTSGVVYGDGAANEAFGLVAAPDGKLTVQGYGAANNFKSGTDGVAGGFLVQSVVLKNNVASHYKNGVLIDTDTHTFATDLQKLVLGAEIKGAGESQMEISAVLIYNRALSAAEQAQTETYLQSKYVGGTISNARRSPSTMPSSSSRTLRSPATCSPTTAPAPTATRTATRSPCTLVSDVTQRHFDPERKRQLHLHARHGLLRSRQLRLPRSATARAAPIGRR